jgi:hypothetical protein
MTIVIHNIVIITLTSTATMSSGIHETQPRDGKYCHLNVPRLPRTADKYKRFDECSVGESSDPPL